MTNTEDIVLCCAALLSVTIDIQGKLTSRVVDTEGIVLCCAALLSVIVDVQGKFMRTLYSVVRLSCQSLRHTG